MAIKIGIGNDGYQSESSADNQAELALQNKSQTPNDEVAPELCPQQLSMTVECKGESNSPICRNMCPIGLRKTKEF